MPDQKNNAPEHDFPAGLAKPAIRALSGAGYTRLEQLTRVKEADLAKLHGMGPKGIGILRSALKARRLSFAVPASNTKDAASKEPVFDSPSGWVKSHIQSYVESGGQNGQMWHGVPTLLLTTRGRKSGKLRRTALIYGQDGENYLVVASQGGAPKHPLWYLNLVKNPEVELQVGAELFAGRARTATAKEKKRLWLIMSKIWPQYDEYQAKTSREIPLVIVEPV